MLRLALVLLLAACGAKPATGPAWPKTADKEVDGGESLEPRGVVTAVEASKSDDDDKAKPDATASTDTDKDEDDDDKSETPKPATETPQAEDEIIITTEEIVIEIDDE